MPEWRTVYISAGSENDVTRGFNFLWVVVPGRDAFKVHGAVAVTRVPAEDRPSSADLRGQVVELVEYFCLEHSLFKALLLAEGVLVLGR